MAPTTLEESKRYAQERADATRRTYAVWLHEAADLWYAALWCKGNDRLYRSIGATVVTKFRPRAALSRRV